MFHLHNTLPHPGSSTPGGSYHLTQGYATPTILLLISYCKEFLPLPCTPRHRPGIPYSSPTSHAYLYQPSFCGVLLTTYQQCYGTFLLQIWYPAHQTCWLLAFWYNAPLPACSALPHHVRTVQTHAGSWQSLAIGRNHHHAPTQSIPIVSGLMGCQEHYHSLVKPKLPTHKIKKYLPTNLVKFSLCTARRNPLHQ